MTHLGPGHVVAAWLACGLAGCVLGEGEGGLAWRGAQVHFELEGELDGKRIRLQQGGESAAMVECKREYNCPDLDPVTWAECELHEVNIDTSAEVFRAEHLLHLEIQRHDLQRRRPGTVVEIVSRQVSRPNEEQAWMQVEVKNGLHTRAIFRGSAQRGEFVLGEFTGNPSQGAFIPGGEGSVGGAFEIHFEPGDHLRGSFAAPCRRRNQIHVVAEGGGGEGGGG